MVLKQKPIPPKKPKNKEAREREHLTPYEVKAVIEAAQRIGRYGHRNSTMIMLAYRHGLRVSELLSLKWGHVDLKQGHIYINRRKNGISTTHPLFGQEIRALQKIRREDPDSAYVFMTERKGPMTDTTFRKIVAQAGRKVKLGFPIHPHMLRHATGFKLANEGRDTRTIQHYLGHKNIQHTVRYTEIAAHRFKDLWDD